MGGGFIIIFLVLRTIHAIDLSISIKSEKLVMFGDSIVKSSSLPKGSKLSDYVKFRLDCLSEGSAVWQVVNSGIGKETAYNATKRIKKVLIEERPDYISISYGLNDCAKKNPLWYKNNLSALISIATATMPTAIIFLITTVPFDESKHPWGSTRYFVKRGGINKYIDREINSATRALAIKYSFPLVDIYRFLSPSQIWTRSICRDGIHPDQDGNKIAGTYIGDVIYAYYAAYILKEESAIDKETAARENIRRSLMLFISSKTKKYPECSILINSAWDKSPYLPQSYNPFRLHN